MINKNKNRWIAMKNIVFFIYYALTIKIDIIYT
jgi:hypothetical protein